MAQKQLEYEALLNEEKLSVDELPMPIRKRINVIRPLIAKFNQNPTPKMKEAIIKSDIEIAEMIADYIEKDLPEQNEGGDDDDNNNSSKNNRRNNNDDDDDGEENSNADGNDDDDDNSSNKPKPNNKKVNKPAAKTAEEIEAEKAARQAEIDKAAEEKIAAKEAAAKEAAEKAEAEKIEAEKAAEKAKDDAKKPITNFGNLDWEKKIIENCSKNNGFISEKDLISIIGKSPDYPYQKVFSITLKKVFLKSLYQLV